jgi:hypothetical protein
MQVNRWLKAAVFTAAAAASTVVLGQAQNEARGPYFGGGIGGGTDVDGVWSLLAGYRLHRNIAVEGAYTDLRRLKLNGQQLDDGTAFELSALGILPLNESFSVFGRLGGYRGRAKGNGFDEKHGDLTFGAGGEFLATSDLGVRVQWQRYAGFGGGGLGSKDEDVLLLNGIYYFR